jgi:hypothetical protein
MKYVDFKMREKKLFFIRTKWQIPAISPIFIHSTTVPLSPSLMFYIYVSYIYKSAGTKLPLRM